MPDPRPMTVSELVFRLADFKGDEPVHFGDRWPVCSAERIWDSAGAVVVLSASPPREVEPDPRRWWRAVAEAVKGLAGVRVTRGPLGGYQPLPAPGARLHPPQGGTGTIDARVSRGPLPAPDFRCPEGAKVILVEYSEGRPFTVITSDDRGLRNEYDFEWCERDQACYYSVSATGAIDSREIRGRAGGPVEAWWDDSSIEVRAPKGVQRLARLPGNPFDDAEPGDAVYCFVCGDFLPDDDRPCDHLEWSDDDGDFVGPGREDP